MFYICQIGEKNGAVPVVHRLQDSMLFIYLFKVVVIIQLSHLIGHIPWNLRS